MKRICSILQAGTLTPTGLCVWAGAVTAVFALAHLAGWREQVTVLSGTLPLDSTFVTAQLKTAVYLAAYFGTVVGAPILLIAATLLKVWSKAIGCGSVSVAEPGRRESRPSATRPTTPGTPHSP